VVDLFTEVGVLYSRWSAPSKVARPGIHSILDEADRFAAFLKKVNRLIATSDGVKIDASQTLKHSVAGYRLLLDDLTVKLDQETKRWEARNSVAAEEGGDPYC